MRTLSIDGARITATDGYSWLLLAQPVRRGLGYDVHALCTRPDGTTREVPLRLGPFAHEAWRRAGAQIAEVGV
jgi:hypothetical protein